MGKRLCTALLCLLLLTGCGGDAKVSDQVFEGGVNTYEGVTMTVVEGTAYPGAVTVQILNTTDKEIDSGNAHDFGLQKEVDGEWYWLEMKKGSYSNTAAALIYSKDVPVEQELTWASRYGSLTKGHYRVTKWLSEYREPGEYTDFLLAAEFDIK